MIKGWTLLIDNCNQLSYLTRSEQLGWDLPSRDITVIYSHTQWEIKLPSCSANKRRCSLAAQTWQTRWYAYRVHTYTLHLFCFVQWKYDSDAALQLPTYCDMILSTWVPSYVHAVESSWREEALYSFPFHSYRLLCLTITVCVCSPRIYRSRFDFYNS